MAKLDKQNVIVSVRDFFEINNTADSLTIRRSKTTERFGRRAEPGWITMVRVFTAGAVSTRPTVQG